MTIILKSQVHLTGLWVNIRWKGLDPLNHAAGLDFCFGALLMFFPATLCLLFTYCKEGKPSLGLNYFPSPCYPASQIASPPSTVSSRKSICARGGTL